VSEKVRKKGRPLLAAPCLVMVVPAVTRPRASNPRRQPNTRASWAVYCDWLYKHYLSADERAKERKKSQMQVASRG
jgi:hypothetical protein